MKKVPLAALLAAWLLMVQAPGGASAPAAPQPVKPSAAPRQGGREVATHSTTGVVKSVTMTVLVITRRTAGKRAETSFVLTPATQRAGAVTAGSTVEVRYRTDGRQRIATAISVEAARK